MRKRLIAIAGVVLMPGVLWLGFQAWTLAVTPGAGPLIGLSSDTAWHSRIGLSNTTYQVALTRAGARIYEFRPGDVTAVEILDTVDGLVIAGGFDIDPERYGGDPRDAETPDGPRDALEIALVEGALARDLPVLGICRGLQILNVAHGGTLRSLRSHPQLGPAHGGELEWQHQHPVEIAAGSQLAAIEGGAGRKAVNSFHGQGIDRVGERLVPVAHSGDGVVEAVERRDKTFVLGLQWHPEVLSLQSESELRPLRALVNAAREYAKVAGRE